MAVKYWEKVLRVSSHLILPDPISRAHTFFDVLAIKSYYQKR